jgi:hypothetical protein
MGPVAPLLTAHKARLAKDLQMLGGSRLGDSQGLRKRTYAEAVTQQQLEHAPACPMGQGLEGNDRFLPVHNTSVRYRFENDLILF